MKRLTSCLAAFAAALAAVSCQSPPPPSESVSPEVDAFTQKPYAEPTPAPTPEPTPAPIPAPAPIATPTPAPAPPVVLGDADVHSPAISDANDGLPSETAKTEKKKSGTGRDREGVDWDAYFKKEYPRVKVSPSDESATNPEFKTFVNQFKSAVMRRDLDALEPMIDTDNIVCGDGESGMLAFVKQWDLAFQPRQSPVWRQFSTALDAGCAWEEDEQAFVAPAYKFKSKYARDLLDESIFPEHQAVITGRRVRVRSLPNLSGEIVEELSYEVVKVMGPPDSSTMTQISGAKAPWFEIELFDGRTGFVWGGFVRPLNIGRAVFRQAGGEWKLVEFAGK